MLLLDGELETELKDDWQVEILSELVAVAVTGKNLGVEKEVSHERTHSSCCYRS